MFGERVVGPVRVIRADGPDVARGDRGHASEAAAFLRGRRAGNR